MRLRATFRRSKSLRTEGEKNHLEREIRMFNSDVFKAYYSSETNGSIRQLTYEYTNECVYTSYENCTTEESRTRQFEHFLSVKC